MSFIEFYRPQIKFHFVLSAMISLLGGYHYSFLRGAVFFIAYNLFFLAIG